MKVSRIGLFSSASLLALGGVALTSSEADAAACLVLSGSAWTVTGSTGSCVTWSGTSLILTSNGTISVSSGIGVEVTGNGDTILNDGAVLNSGAISSSTMAAIQVDSGILLGTLVNTGSLSAPNPIIVEGTLGTLDNSGTIDATGYAAVWADGGSITSIVNRSTGVMTGLHNGIVNAGSIGQLTNLGTISGQTMNGIRNESGGTIGTITNSGTITSALSNQGTGQQNGIWNKAGGTIVEIDNLATGRISGYTAGIKNSAAIGAISNTGTISGLSYGLQNSGSIGSINNTGVLSGGTYGVYNTGSATIGTIDNAGTIAGNQAAINNASIYLGPITNSGVIAGAIVNSSTADMTINGGSGGTYGLLTGYNNGSASSAAVGTIGTITNSASDLWLASGNIWLNDDILISGHTVHVTNATVKVSNAISITGTYSQTGGGLVVVNGGSINISNASAATVTNTAITISGSNLSAGTYTIVNANAAGTYSNDTVTISGTNGLTATLVTTDGGNDLAVVLSSGSTSSSPDYAARAASAGGAAKGMGPALDAIAASSGSTATAFQNSVLSPLSSLPAAAQQTAIKQLAPSQLTPFAQVATQAASPTTSVIEQHELSFASNGGAGAAAGSSPHAWGLWGQVLGGAAFRDGNRDADGYKASHVGLVTGLDHQFNGTTMGGLAVSWVRGWSWGTGDSSGSYTGMDSYQLTGYGLHRFGRAFVDGQAGLGYNTFDQTRAIGFLGQRAKAKYNGQQYLLKVGTGYDFPVDGDLVVTPLAGLRYLRAVTDHYDESGSSANLSVDRRGVNSLTHDIGAKLSWKLDSAWGRLVPEIRLAWTHDYVQGPIASSGIIGGQIFSSTVSRTNPDGGKLNLALTLDGTDDFSLRAEYEGEVRPDYQSHTGLLKAAWEF